MGMMRVEGDWAPAGSEVGVSALLRQPRGFERVAFEPETAKGSAKRQVVLYTEQMAVTQPVGIVDLAFEADTAAATLPAQLDASQDSAIQRDQPPHLALHAGQRFGRLGHELRDRFLPVARSCLRPLAYGVVVAVDVPQLRNDVRNTAWIDVRHCGVPAAHHVHVLLRHRPRSIPQAGMAGQETGSADSR